MNLKFITLLALAGVVSARSVVKIEAPAFVLDGEVDAVCPAHETPCHYALGKVMCCHAGKACVPKVGCTCLSDDCIANAVGTETDTVSTAGTHYGNPADGCLPDEQAEKVNGVTGDFCSPKCSSSTPCPTDLPAGTTAAPQCVLESPGSQTPDHCALICKPGLGFLKVGDGGCPTGAACQAIQGTGVCTYSAGPAPPSPPPTPPAPPAPPAPGGGHYGDPNKGPCLADEEAVSITGVTGKFCSPACSSSSPCPAVPAGTTAQAQCVVETPGSQTPNHCAIICKPGLEFLAVGDGGCMSGATCQPIQGTGICTYAN